MSVCGLVFVFVMMVMCFCCGVCSIDRYIVLGVFWCSLWMCLLLMMLMIFCLMF